MTVGRVESVTSTRHEVATEEMLSSSLTLSVSLDWTHLCGTEEPNAVALEILQQWEEISSYRSLTTIL